MKAFAKGLFSNAYKVDEAVILHSLCPTKECYALFCQENELAPKVEVLDHQVYRMPFYERVSSPKKQLKQDDYELYAELRRVSCSGYRKLHSFFSELSSPKIGLVLGLLDDMANYIDSDDLSFEISPRNIGVNEKGDLVLLDCFFDKSLAKKVRDKQLKLKHQNLKDYMK